MLASIPSASILGISGHPVFVEVHVSSGAPAFAVVGLPDAACREARDRVRAAVMSSGFKQHGEAVRLSDKRITVNLAPSDIHKNGSAMDLAIAIGFLVAIEILDPADVAGASFIGELGLDGSIRSVTGMVPLVDACQTEAVVVPASSGRQASLVGRHKIRAARSLRELVECLKMEEPWPDFDDGPGLEPHQPVPDIADVKGQPMARWALEVAAAGGHNLLLNGPPGSGKTMLAQRLGGLMPDLSARAALSVTKIHSAAGLLADDAGLIRRPPFRSPHHTASIVSLIGGGSNVMRPGEISLADNGILFVDELPEAPRGFLEALRQPLEDGKVHIARARVKVTFPARFLCVAAMNPCPCGEGLEIEKCRCPESVRLRYAGKISGPLFDRFDLRIKVLRPKIDQFFETRKTESTADVRARVIEARERMATRGALNSALSADQLAAHAPLSDSATQLVRNEMVQQRLTARGLHRLHRVALTLADLDGSSVLKDSHVASALALRGDGQGN